MRIAIIGTGISGMVAARVLHEEHDLTVFEAGGHVGGHTHTVPVQVASGSYDVDTGFIVYNERNYPAFTRLLDWLEVETQPTEMSFSVRNEQSGLEYSATSLNTLFAQRRNLVRPSFYRMIVDIVRFFRAAKRFLESGDTDLTLEGFLDREGYSRRFIEDHIVPMGAAIWSADPANVRSMPAHFFLRFFENHGFLEVDDRPAWRVIRGGSHRYMRALISPFRDRIRLRTPVQELLRHGDRVEVRTGGGPAEFFDAAIVATHSDQALRLLADPSEPETAILGAIPYQRNDVLLHVDESILPRARRAWAAWNYHVLPRRSGPAAVTYNMNILQTLDAPETFCVTLNREEGIRKDRILGRFVYHHPVFTPGAVRAQRRRHEINGVRRTYYCGAYWGYGFHEDGVQSALDIARFFGKDLDSCTAASTREPSAIGASSR